MKKLAAGDRCEVESQGAWIPATIRTVYPGHSGAMVLPDNWATSVWAKNTQIREPAVNPSSAKRGDYLMGQAVEVQRAAGRWVEGLFDQWEDDTHERAYVATGAYGTERFHHTNIRRPRVEPDPHHPAYQGEIGDHQPYETATVKIMPDVSGFLNNLRRPKRRPLSTGGIIPTQRDLAETLTRLGAATHSITEQTGYIEVATEFAKAGIAPERIKDYVAALCRIIAMGVTPQQVDGFATKTLRDNLLTITDLPHITREYGG